MQYVNASLFLFIFGGMKKTLIILIVILFALQTQAQVNDTLDHIQTKCSSVTSLESNVTKHLVTADSTLIEEGTLYYVHPDRIASYFERGNYMIVNGNQMKINIGIFHGRFKLSRNKTMRSLSHIYLFAVQGRCREFAEEGNFYMQTHVSQGYYTVQFTTKKKHFLGLGYQQISFFYDQNDLLIKKIELIDSRNIIETFTISKPQYGISIDESKFAL